MDAKEIRCLRCGATNNSDYVFCEKCGNKLDRPNYCRKCGKRVEKDMIFCPACGISLYEQDITQIGEPKSNYKNEQNAKKIIFFTSALLMVLTIALLFMHNKKSNFQKVFEKAGGKNYIGEWVSVSNDGKSLIIDTNPGDIEDYYEPDALSAIRKIHSTLGLPDSLITKMTQTRVIDGRQSESYDNITVSWTYHPNLGLEIIYERE